MALYRSHTDPQLTALLKSGDSHAFTEIYERYWETLFAIAYNYHRQKETAEEIVQEIFLRLWDKRAAVEIEDLGAYLATACKFGVFKQVARQRRRAVLLEAHTEPLMTAEEEETITTRFLEEYLRGVIEQLPGQCRVVYQLRREQGLSTEEIARELGISPHTARNHLNKALKTLRLSLRQAHLCLQIFL